MELSFPVCYLSLVYLFSFLLFCSSAISAFIVFQFCSSSLGFLSSCKSKLPPTPLRPLVCLSFEFPVLVPYHPVQECRLCLGLSLPVLPTILPSIISFCRESSLIMCRIQFFCLVLIMSVKDLFSSTSFNTSSFVLCYVRLILFILLHIHILKASIRLTPPFSSSMHVSASYTVTLHISALTILLLMSLFIPLLNNLITIKKVSIDVVCLGVFIFASLFFSLLFLVVLYFKIFVLRSEE